MKRSSLVLTVMVCATTLCATRMSHAADGPGWYAGIAVAQVSPHFGRLDDDLEVVGNTLHDDTGFKVIAGLRPFDWLALQPAGRPPGLLCARWSFTVAGRQH